MLPASKQGRAWLVSEGDLAAFLEGVRTEVTEGRVRWDRRFRNRLLAADEAGAWAVVEAAAASGMDLRSAYRELIIPAMSRIGVLWEAGDIDVATEHAASQVASRVVARLGPLLARRGVSRGVIVLGSTATELHGLPLSIAADVLRGANYEVIDLGPNLPPGSFAHAVRSVGGVVAVAIGVTTPGQHTQLAETMAAVRKAGESPVVVGGAGVTAEEAARLGADGWARSAEDAVEVFERLLRR